MDITVALVRRLLETQFPPFAHLEVRKVEPGGHDNRTFRVGDDLAARLPSAAGYAAAVEKEHRWLPRLASRLPCPIPAPRALGAPGSGYPWPWSINRWIAGTDAATASYGNHPEVAEELGRFLVALRRVDAAGGPPAGAQSFHRGASLTNYDTDTRAALKSLAPAMPPAAIAAATHVWDQAIASEWDRAPVWFHGDLAPGNVLIDHGRLSGVIDFGTCGVGDPACDLAIAWTLFEADARRAFADEVGLDAPTWSRGRGWALWKALITAGEEGPARSESIRVIAEILADPVREG